MQALLNWIKSGKLKFKADVVHGLENAPKALLKLFNGSNKGKLCVQVAPGAGTKSRL